MEPQVKTKETILDNVLLGHGDTMVKKPSSKKIKSPNSKIKTKVSLALTNKDKDSIDDYKSISGFESVLLNRKQIYYKKIKKKNRDKMKIELRRKRIEIFIKFILYVLSNIINILSVFNYICQTYFDNFPEEKNVTEALQYLELSFTFYFIFEYFLLFTRIQGTIIKHIFSWDSFIDLITTIPSAISYFIENIGIKLNFVRIFRTFRMLRILRIYKSLKLIQYESNSMNDDGESSYHLKFDPIKIRFLTIIVVLALNFFIGSGVVLALQDLVKGSFSVDKMNFFDATYFMIITYFSVGYGDITPTHWVSRMAVICGLFILIITVSNQISIMVNLLRVWGPGLRTYQGSSHIVVLCDDTIQLSMFLSTIKIKFPDDDIIIVSKDIHSLPSQEYPYDRVQLMFINTIDFEVLERANTRQAKAIFIFSNKSLFNCDQKEKVTDFFILKINRYYHNVPVYVQTLYSERSFKTGTLRKQQRLLKCKKIIPILRIKSLIISKALFNPGFCTFAQNLMFNQCQAPLNIDEYSPIMQSYLQGCENRILVKHFPKFFHNKFFYEACVMIYFRSIESFSQKLM